MERPIEVVESAGHWQRLKRMGGAVIAGIAMAGVALPALAVGTSVEGELGPVSAEIKVTKGTLEIDGGPLGTIEAPAGLPFGLGLKVDLGSINEETYEVVSHAVAEAATGNLNGQEDWLFALGDIESDIQQIKDALLLRILGRGALAAGLVAAGIVFSTEILMGAQRRRELSLQFKKDCAQAQKIIYDKLPQLKFLPTGPSMAMASAVLLVAIPNAVAEELRSLQANLNPETLLQDATADGLAASIQKYGPTIFEEIGEYMDETDVFFDRVSGNLATATETYDFERMPGSRLAMLYSDNHGNRTGAMLSQIAQAFNVDAVFNAGDVSATGSAAEGTIIANDLQAQNFPEAFFVARGNHDSEAIQVQLESVGVTVLDGTMEQGGGFTVIGEADPRESTPIGTKPLAEGEETPKELAQRMLGEACEQEADVLLVHDLSGLPQIGVDAAECGVDLVAAGHMHAHNEPVIIENSDGTVRSIIMDSLGSSTGAAADVLRYGPFKNTAYVYVVEYGPGNTWAAVHIITIDPDAAVQIRRINSSNYPVQEESSFITLEPTKTADTRAVVGVG